MKTFETQKVTEQRPLNYPWTPKYYLCPGLTNTLPPPPPPHTLSLTHPTLSLLEILA